MSGNICRCGAYPNIVAAILEVAKNPGESEAQAGSQELGGGTYTIMTQIAADALGVPVSRVTFCLGDTEYPETPVSGGSQTAASTGSAVHLAGKALREKLIQAAVTDRASTLSGVSAQDVMVEDGKLSVRSHPSQSETFAQFMARQPAMLEGHGDAKPGEEKDRYSMYAF